MRGKCDYCGKTAELTAHGGGLVIGDTPLKYEMDLCPDCMAQPLTGEEIRQTIFRLNQEGRFNPRLPETIVTRLVSDERQMAADYLEASQMTTHSLERDVLQEMAGQSEGQAEALREMQTVGNPMSPEKRRRIEEAARSGTFEPETVKYWDSLPPSARYSILKDYGHTDDSAWTLCHQNWATLPFGLKLRFAIERVGDLLETHPNPRTVAENSVYTALHDVSIPAYVGQRQTRHRTVLLISSGQTIKFLRPSRKPGSNYWQVEISSREQDIIWINPRSLRSPSVFRRTGGPPPPHTIGAPAPGIPSSPRRGRRGPPYTTPTPAMLDQIRTALRVRWERERLQEGTVEPHGELREAVLPPHSVLNAEDIRVMILGDYLEQPIRDRRHGDYTGNVAQLINNSITYKPETLRALEEFKESRPWRGSVENRFRKFKRLAKKLAPIYGIRERNGHRFKLRHRITPPYSNSGSSNYMPTTHTITLLGRFSVLTFLHEFGHSRGMGETLAQTWSINLFKEAFPEKFVKIRFMGNIVEATREVQPSTVRLIAAREDLILRSGAESNPTFDDDLEEIFFDENPMFREMFYPETKIPVWRGDEGVSTYWNRIDRTDRVEIARKAGYFDHNAVVIARIDDFGRFGERMRENLVRVISQTSNPTVEEYEKYPSMFQDMDRDSIPDVDDPEPTVPGDIPIEKTLLSDEFDEILLYQKKFRPPLKRVEKTLIEIVPKTATIKTRIKSPYSIINKLRRKRLAGKKGITDMAGALVIAKDKSQLIRIRKKIEDKFGHRITEVEDFYADPKAGYRGVHYILDGNTEHPVELQLKTIRMKRVTEAAHESYKHEEHDPDEMLRLSQLANRADRGDKAAQKQFDKIPVEDMIMQLKMKFPGKENPKSVSEIVDLARKYYEQSIQDLDERKVDAAETSIMRSSAFMRSLTNEEVQQHRDLSRAIIQQINWIIMLKEAEMENPANLTGIEGPMVVRGPGDI